MACERPHRQRSLAYHVADQQYLYTPLLGAVQFRVFPRLCPELFAVLRVILALAVRIQRYLEVPGKISQKCGDG